EEQRPPAQTILQERPNQIELLFGCEGPGEVEDDAAIARHEDVARVRQEVGQVVEEASPRLRVALEQEHERHVEGEHRVIQGEDAESAPGVERADVDASALLLLPQEQRADQKAAEGEEELHSVVAALQEC